MSYQVIARKWRPQTFEEVTGQEAITRTLRNGVEHERLHHAYLFSGARGVGKTTTARLLAKALNCHKTEKPNPRPCSPNDEAPMCASCREIAEGRSIDVLEIDAASNTGVDNVREVIINNLGIAPARDRYKVFIIDEVHMLSASSFNALLKSIEEPPPRVVFIMATTELHKVPDTILSRCQEFEFRTIATQKIFERLKLIADAEKINVADDALREIARAGEGSMRDAQSAFDQVISFSGARIETVDVMTALGIAGSEMLTQTVGAIGTGDARKILQVVEELTKRGQDLRNFCRDLLARLRDLLVAKIAPDAEELLDSASSSRAELAAQTRDFTEADLTRFFNSLSETETQLRAASQPRYILEIGLIKLIEMRRVAPLEKILERLAHLENVFSNGSSAAPAAGGQTAKSETVSKPIDLKYFDAPTPEKKTLNVDFPLSEVPFPVLSGVNSTVVSNGNSAANGNAAAQAAFDVSPIAATVSIEAAGDFPIREFSSPEEFSPVEENILIEEVVSLERDLPVKSDAAVLSFSDASPRFSARAFLETVTVKLPPITSEDLEHVEDNYLDQAFEDRLTREGDSLNVIKNASLIVERAAGANGFSNDSPFKSESPNSNGASSVAAAKRLEKPAAPIAPIFEPEKISDEMPVMPENPTKEDLWRYAENHPKVKLALRVFRGKIVDVARRQFSEKT